MGTIARIRSARGSVMISTGMSSSIISNDGPIRRASGSIAVTISARRSSVMAGSGAASGAVSGAGPGATSACTSGAISSSGRGRLLRGKRTASQQNGNQ